MTEHIQTEAYYRKQIADALQALVNDNGLRVASLSVDWIQMGTTDYALHRIRWSMEEVK